MLILYMGVRAGSGEFISEKKNSGNNLLHELVTFAQRGCSSENLIGRTLSQFSRAPHRDGARVCSLCGPRFIETAQWADGD